MSDVVPGGRTPHTQPGFGPSGRFSNPGVRDSRMQFPTRDLLANKRSRKGGVEMTPEDFAREVMGLNQAQMQQLHNGQEFNIYDSLAAYNRIIQLPPTVFMKMLDDSAKWPFTVALPRLHLEDAVIVSIMEEEYNPGYLDPKADRAPSMQLTSKMRELKVSLDKFGKSLEMNAEFYNTPTGQANYVMKQKQIVECTANSLVLTAMLALVSAEPNESSFRGALEKLDSENALIRLITDQASLTGAIQRRAIDRVLAIGTRAIRSQTGSEANAIVLSEDAIPYAKTLPRNNGVKVYKDPALPVPGGDSVVECLKHDWVSASFAYLTLRDTVRSGKAFPIRGEQYLGLYDEDLDEHDQRIYLWDMLKYSGVLDKSGKKFGPIGDEYFASYATWVDYMIETSCFDLVANAARSVDEDRATAVIGGVAAAPQVAASADGVDASSPFVRYDIGSDANADKSKQVIRCVGDEYARALQAYQYADIDAGAPNIARKAVMRYIVTQIKDGAVPDAAVIADIMRFVPLANYVAGSYPDNHAYVTGAALEYLVSQGPLGARVEAAKITNGLFEAMAALKQAGDKGIDGVKSSKHKGVIEDWAKAAFEGLNTKAVIALNKIDGNEAGGIPNDLWTLFAKRPSEAPEFFYVLQSLGLPLPAGMLIFRPSRRYQTCDALVARFGNELGNTYTGKSTFEMSANAHHGTVFGQFAMRYAARVVKPRLIVRIPNVMFTQYYGGNSTKPIDISKDSHRSPDGGDMYCLFVPPDFKPSDPVLSMSGRILPNAGRSLSFPTADLYHRLLRLMDYPDFSTMGLEGCDPYADNVPAGRIIGTLERFTYTAGHDTVLVHGNDSIGPAIAKSSCTRRGLADYFPVPGADNEPVVGRTALDSIPGL